MIPYLLGFPLKSILLMAQLIIYPILTLLLKPKHCLVHLILAYRLFFLIIFHYFMLLVYQPLDSLGWISQSDGWLQILYP